MVFFKCSIFLYLISNFPSFINYFEQPLFCNEGRIPCEYYPKDFKRKVSTGAAPRVTLPNIRASLGNNLHQVTIKYFVLIASKRWLGTGTVLARLFGLDWSHSPPFPPRTTPHTLHKSVTPTTAKVRHQASTAAASTSLTNRIHVGPSSRVSEQFWFNLEEMELHKSFSARQIFSFRSPFCNALLTRLFIL